MSDSRPRMLRLLIALLLLVGLIRPTVAASLTWEWHGQGIGATPINRLAWGRGEFVAAGEDGSLLVSGDGNQWNRIDLPGAGTLTDLLWAGERFVAVSERGLIFTSPDGQDWREAETPTAGSWRSIAWGAGHLVVTGDEPGGLLSTDGLHWQSIPSPAGLLRLSWGDGRFVGIARDGVVWTSTDGQQWVSRGKQIQALQLDHAAIAWGHGLFVLAGGGYAELGSVNAVLTSPDGVTWTERTAGVRGALTDITWDGKRFVAVSREGFAGEFFLTSPDGATWEARTLERSMYAENYPTAITFRNGLYVIGYAGGRIQVSQNGTDWTESLKGFAVPFNDVIWDQDRFVAVGAFSQVATAKDGRTWTVRTAAMGLASPTTILHAGGLYVVGEEWGVWTSPDLVSWTPHHFDQLPAKGLAWGAGRFVAVGGNGAGPAIWTSLDGYAWSAVPDLPTRLLKDVAWGAGRFVAVGGYSDKILTSTDGLKWEPTNQDGSFDHVVWAAGRFMAIGSGRVYTSTDGLIWRSTLLTHPKRHPFGQPGADVLWVDGLWIVLGEDGDLYTATDDLIWRRHSSGTSALRGLAWGDGHLIGVGRDGALLTLTDSLESLRPLTAGRPAPSPAGPMTGITAITAGTGLIAVGADGRIASSDDGTEWRPILQGPRGDLSDVAQGSGRWVAVGEDGLILTSTGGESWRQALPGSDDALRAVAWGAGRFVVVGEGGSILASPDGATWDEVSPKSAGFAWRDVAWGGGQFVAVGASGRIRSSSDGIAWYDRQGRLGDPDLRAVALGLDRFLAVGVGGAVYASPDGVTWRKEAGAPEGLIALQWLNGWFMALGESGRLYRSADGGEWAEAASAGDWRGLAVRGDRLLRFQADGSTESISVAPRCGMRFRDVPLSNPACEAIEGLEAAGIVGGFPDGTFQPGKGVTRAEFAKMLVGLMGMRPSPGTLPFTDVADHWASRVGYLQAAVGMGAFGGFPDGSFHPDAPVTRAQVIKIAAAALHIEPGGVHPYQDVKPTDWYAGWVAAAIRRGLIGAGGTWPIWTESTLRPDQPATRAEAALVLANLQKALRR